MRKLWNRIVNFYRKECRPVSTDELFVDRCNRIISTYKMEVI